MLTQRGLSLKVKVKVVSLYSASSRREHAHASNALFVTNPSRQLHSHRVQPADTGWHSGRLGNPSQLYQGPHLP